MVSIHASVKDATNKFAISCSRFKVSIHASVKDATIGSAYIRSRKDVSIHASVKDATWSVKSLHVVSVFQSTHL